MNLSPAMGDCGAASGVGVSMASGFVTVVGIIRPPWTSWARNPVGRKSSIRYVIMLCSPVQRSPGNPTILVFFIIVVVVVRRHCPWCPLMSLITHQREASFIILSFHSDNHRDEKEQLYNWWECHWWNWEWWIINYSPTTAGEQMTSVAPHCLDPFPPAS